MPQGTNTSKKSKVAKKGNAQTTPTKRKTKYRDMIRKLAFGVNFMVVGVENQEEVHYLMPLRTMEYDMREYQRQAAIIRKRNRKGRKLTPGEYLSGFAKEDKLYPCVTFVLYYGDEWDGSRELHELLDFSDIPEELKALVNNYKIHLIEIRKLEDTSVFKTDLKQVFDFIRYSEDKNKLRELVEQDEAYQHLDEEAYDMVALYTKSTELLKMKKQKKEGGVNMCKGIRDWMQDEREGGRAEGRIETVITMCKKFALTKEQIMQQLMDVCSLDREAAEKLIAE